MWDTSDYLVVMQSILEKIRAGHWAVMGILNVTPDSFSDGGRFNQVDRALSHALQMEKDGASVIDIGGESTRPGAVPVPLEEELERVIPVIEKIRANSDVAISIDTSKPELMRAAIAMLRGSRCRRRNSNNDCDRFVPTDVVAEAHINF